MPVPLHAATDNLAFQHVEGGKQRSSRAACSRGSSSGSGPS
jgi:hypothetical protein